MKPGPKPKTAVERRATGNSGHRKKTLLVDPVDAPPAAPLIPLDAGPIGDAPDFLSAKQQALWRKVAPTLQTLRLLQAPDSLAFGRYIGWLVRFIELEGTSRRRPIVEKTAAKRGKMDRLDKGFQALLLVDKRLQEYEDRFGMNPRERQALMARLAGAPGAQPPAPAARPKDGEEVPRVKDSPIGGLRGTASLQ